MGEALLAAHHGEQLGVERRVPVPGQAELPEGAVERLPMQVLGLGQRAVDVEDQRPQHGRSRPEAPSAPARIAAMRSA